MSFLILFLECFVWKIFVVFNGKKLHFNGVEEQPFLDVILIDVVEKVSPNIKVWVLITSAIMISFTVMESEDRGKLMQYL
jgi:hypothetical protein